MKDFQARHRTKNKEEKYDAKVHNKKLKGSKRLSGALLFSSASLLVQHFSINIEKRHGSIFIHCRALSKFDRILLKKN